MHLPWSTAVVFVGRSMAYLFRAILLDNTQQEGMKSHKQPAWVSIVGLDERCITLTQMPLAMGSLHLT